MNTRLPPAWSRHLKTSHGPRASPAPKAKPLAHAQSDDALLRQALELQQAARLPEAEDLCHRVLARTPNHPLSLYILGTLGFDVDKELALQYFARAVGEAPRNPYFHLSLGEAYLKVGEHEPAVRH